MLDQREHKNMRMEDWRKTSKMMKTAKSPVWLSIGPAGTRRIKEPAMNRIIILAAAAVAVLTAPAHALEGC